MKKQKTIQLKTTCQTKKTKLFRIGIAEPLVGDFLEDAFDMLSNAVIGMNFELCILAEGSHEIQKNAIKFDSNFPDHFSIIENSKTGFSNLLDSCDAVIVIDETRKELLKQIIQKGVVPIVSHKQTIFKDFEAVKETGNCFAYDKENFWSLLQAIVKCGETYRYSYDWRLLKNNIIKVSVS